MLFPEADIPLVGILVPNQQFPVPMPVDDVDSHIDPVVELKKGFQGLEQPVFLMEILLPDPFLKTRYGLASESEGTGIEILYRFGKQEDTGYRFCDFFRIPDD
jgi:hypothetical protein